MGPQPEQCDGRDQDCDGLSDPDDDNADGSCVGVLSKCVDHGGRATCLYYPACFSPSCCSEQQPCSPGDECERVLWDCDLCETCTCNVCYRH